MKNIKDGFGYNERLFSGGLRRKLHMARFRWFSAQLASLKCPADCVVELGCFDGKLIDFLPSPPSRYVGFDANHEGGLDIARKRWEGKGNYVFRQISSPEEMNFNDREFYQVAVTMETLEHVPPEMIDGFLRKISDHLDGYLFVTVPNETGLVFLAKWTVKKLMGGDAKNYSFTELVNATLGRMKKVARSGHKGFDYRDVIEKVADCFEIVSVSGHPFGFFPAPFCFGIGIVAKSKRR